jgi:hypothetical protein
MANLNYERTLTSPPSKQQLAAAPDVFAPAEFIDLPALAPRGFRLCLSCSLPVYDEWQYGERHKAWHVALAAALGDGA